MMRFALAGNPNCGKTTLFNTLTGSSARVGNWPGVTVERKEGIYTVMDEQIKVIDLPGIYSLSPYTPEEVVARNYIIDEHPELIINIVDATNLERSLYLTTQLLETDCPVVVALNMMDEVRKIGARIDTAELSRKIGMPVIEISALKKNGVKTLMEEAFKQASLRRAARTVLASTPLGCAVTKLNAELAKFSVTHPVFHAVKLLEGDKIEEAHVDDSIIRLAQSERSNIRLDKVLGGDFEAAVADARYKYITEHFSPCFHRNKFKTGPTASEKIDRILTHKYFGIPIFFLVMLTVFHFTFGSSFLFIDGLKSPGVFLQELTGDLLEKAAGAIGQGLLSLGTAEWAYGLLIDGLLAGVISILTFLPQILILFLFLSLMEDSGYMSRAAFLMDRPLRKFGLSGKAFLPLLMGFGCSVPAIMGTRTLETERDRRFTILLIPFFSCGAKMPIWAMLTSLFFPKNADLVIFGIYAFGVISAVLMGIILKKTLFRSDASTFIMELPAYHLPRFRNLFMLLWEKAKDFIIRASTVIAVASVVIWIISNFNMKFQMVEVNSADSILGRLGSFLIPVFRPLGFVSGAEGWKTIAAIFSGLIAREAVVSTMGVLYTTEAAITSALGISGALSFITFLLLSVPCMAAVAAMRTEMRNWKWTAFAILFWTITAYFLSIIVYFISSMLLMI